MYMKNIVKSYMKFEVLRFQMFIGYMKSYMK